MDWIKKNTEKFALLVLSLALLGVSVLLFFNYQKFVAGFQYLTVKPFESDKLPPLETKSMETALAELDKPSIWTFNQDKDGYMFVSRAYAVQDDGKLSEPLGKMWYPPVPNDWIVKYHLDLLDPDIINEDSNGNGFTNLEKWKTGCDPTDKNSHPAYTTKLFLEKYIQVPFRLLFNGKPDDKSFQIDTIDLHQPTQILQMGDAIEGTKYKIIKYEEKHSTDASGIDHDVSELTIQNTETGKQVILVMGIVGSDPDSYALFKYFWGNPPTEIKVKLGGTFSIKPEADVQYKLIDIDANHATIVNLKTNDQLTIPILTPGTTFHEK